MTSLNEFNELQEQRDINRRLQAKLARAEAQTADLVAAVYQAAHDAAVLIGKPEPVPAPPKDQRKHPEAALIHFTDPQYGKLTTSYNMDVCRQRVELLGQKVVLLTDIQRADHPVTEAHLALGGDFTENVNIFPGQHFEIEAGLYEQLFGIAKITGDLILTLLQHFEVVHVWEEDGNHGRLGRRGDFPLGDNTDRMSYEITRQQFLNEPRLVWHSKFSWYNHMSIGNYGAVLVHGDEIKSFGGNTPYFGILRKANAWATGVIPGEWQDIYMGHYHTWAELPLANGGLVYMTGSPESDNEYAREFVAAQGPPTQLLNFIDLERGRVTAKYQVYL